MRNSAPVLAAALVLAACSRSAPAVPELSDEPVLAPAARKDLPEYVPGYGIAVAAGGSVQFEVNLEAEDGPLVKPGQAAVVLVPPGRSAIPCRVARVLRDVSEETHQSLAWLAPARPPEVPANEFIYANILVRVKPKALSVPAAAVLVRDGRLYAVKASGKGGERKFQPVEVSTETAAGEDVEIRSGLAAGDEVVVHGAIGFLYPDFKSHGED